MHALEMHNVYGCSPTCPANLLRWPMNIEPSQRRHRRLPNLRLRARTIEHESVEASVGRPSLLIAAFAAIAGFIARIVGHNLYRITSYTYDGTQYGGPDIQPVTPNDAFYVVTKNNIDPNPIELWSRLEIADAMERPRSYRFSELITLPANT